jgi:hypothetical protein
MKAGLTNTFHDLLHFFSISDPVQARHSKKGSSLLSHSLHSIFSSVKGYKQQHGAIFARFCILVSSNFFLLFIKDIYNLLRGSYK